MKVMLQHSRAKLTCEAMCFAVSMGMAKETPSATTAFMEDMPTTSPSRFTRGPPELPLLVAASVWMYSVFGPARPSSTACKGVAACPHKQHMLSPKVRTLRGKRK